MNAARLNEAADEIRGAINLSTSGGKAHAALDDLLAALDAAEQRAEDFRVTQAALRAALDEAEARAVQAEQERDTQHGRAAGAELERDRLAARAEAAEARLAETLDLLRDGADMAERYMGTLTGGLESWVILVRAALTTHPEEKP